MVPRSCYRGSSIFSCTSTISLDGTLAEARQVELQTEHIREHNPLHEHSDECFIHVPAVSFIIVLQILRILDRLLWIIDILDLLSQPHNSRPYVQIGMIVVLLIRSLFSIARLDFLPSSQFNCLMVMLTCFRFLAICCFHVNVLSIVIPRYLMSVFRGI
jgi:hypothetical protein